MSSDGSIVSANVTMALREAASVVSHYTVRDAIPAFMLESITFGIASIALVLAGYTVLRWQHLSKKHILPYLSACLAYAAFATHWVLSLRFYKSLIHGLTFGQSPEDSLTAVADYLSLEFDCFVGEAVLFGALTSLVSLLLGLFLKGDNQIPRTRSSILPFSTVLIMYAMASLHWIFNAASWISICGAASPVSSGPCNWYGWYTGPPNRLAGFTLMVNIICSDAIVLWRACAVWLYKRHIVYTSAALIVLTTLSTATNWAMTFWSGGMNTSEPLSSIPGYTAVSASLLSNLFATCAIAFKAWMHRKYVQKSLAMGSPGLIAGNVLLIIIESGSLYMVLWIVYLMCTVSPRVLVLDNMTVFSYSVIQLIATYPTIIIILVFLEKRHHASRSIANTPSHVDIPPILTISTMIHPTHEKSIALRAPRDAEAGLPDDPECSSRASYSTEKLDDDVAVIHEIHETSRSSLDAL
ncbi:hypothetical protein K488DRAFT_87543 [Vararia minispora EC-137]|uniref:Uncharacterized protein n=1 Tax=Vararia minispora EC-137 TaxID=1314806 RepID=A0ACB8QGD3_9AGAM|nr:hypothetical protein K488DRAFT_87543 [Vararia minispora EC-137]